MNGSKAPVIVIASTNRAEVLDRALVRPGRFDRKVYVGLPDTRGREAILRIHARGRPLEGGVDLGAIARQTTGLSGAELENVLNEACIFAARGKLSAVTAANVEAAIEKVAIGISQRRAVGASARRVTSVHEAGHALAGLAMERWLDARCDLGANRVTKVTVLPRLSAAGTAGGFTALSPDERLVDDGLLSRRSP